MRETRGLTDPAGVVGAILDATSSLHEGGAVKRLAGRIDGVKAGPGGLEVSLGGGSRLDRTLEQTIVAIGEAAAARGVGVLLTVDEVQEPRTSCSGPSSGRCTGPHRTIGRSG